MNQRLLVLLLLAVVAEVLAFQLLRDPLSPGMPLYRVIHLVEMLVLIAIVAAEFGLRDRVATLVLSGLLLSLAGDLINSFLFDLSSILQPQTLLSIPPFVAAHLCYVAAFVILLRQASKPVHWAAAFTAWPLLALGLWWLVIDRSAPPLLLKLSVGYAFVVTLMGVMALLLGLRLGGRAWIPALGGMAFVLSDCLFGSYLLEGQQRPVLASQAIWVTYFLAQVLISRAPLSSPPTGRRPG